MLIRQNIYDLGDDWAEPILWYARGVNALKARQLNDITSWQFYGAIHGYTRWLWDHHGITLPSDPGPADDENNPKYLNQCQHQSWYFLPWHRGYLLAFERQIRHSIEQLGGPHEAWALPYWNYFEDGRGFIPPAFRTQSWPDGATGNPLFVEQRWGPLATDPTYDLRIDVNLNSLNDRDFSGPGNGGSTGFGGPQTGFNWSRGENGGVESQPHNVVHGQLGGSHPTDFLPFPPPNHQIPVPGLMSTPTTAALDPIFWLHHCNIDRLWESWNKFPLGKPTINPSDWNNPNEQNWRDGPAATGDRAFAMPNPDGTEWNFTPVEMEDIATLGYSYDDLTSGMPVQPDIMAARVAILGLAQPASLSGGTVMASNKTVELLGSSGSKVSLSGAASQRSGVQLDTQTVLRLTSSLSGEAVQPELPDRVFLNLENVRSRTDAVLFKVYVGLQTDADPADNPDNLAGTISLFGTALASDPMESHAGAGITHVIEITDIVDRLFLNDAFGTPELSVDLVPVSDIPAAAGVEIGNISIYRQSE